MLPETKAIKDLNIVHVKLVTNPAKIKGGSGSTGYTGSTGYI